MRTYVIESEPPAGSNNFVVTGRSVHFLVPLCTLVGPFVCFGKRCIRQLLTDFTLQIYIKLVCNETLVVSNSCDLTAFRVNAVSIRSAVVNDRVACGSNQILW